VLHVPNVCDGVPEVCYFGFDFLRVYGIVQVFEDDAVGSVFLWFVRVKLGMSVHDGFCYGSVGIGICWLYSNLIVGKSFEFIMFGNNLVKQLD
jgi:hypothetical protein